MSNNSATIHQASDEYLHEISRELSQNTLRAYRIGLNLFLDSLIKKGIQLTRPVEMIKPDYFFSFIVELTKINYSRSTVELYLAALNRFREWLIENQFVVIPSTDDKIYREKVRLLLRSYQRTESPLFNQEITSRKLIDAAQGRDVSQLERNRDLAIIHFLLSTNCRPHEVCKLRISDFDFNNRTAVISLDSVRTRIVHFDKDTAGSLVRYWEFRGWQARNDPAFARHDKRAGVRHLPLSTRSIQNVVQDVRQAAGIDGKVTPDMLRRRNSVAALEYIINLSLADAILSFNSFSTKNQYSRSITE